jgi:hypothetical protein
MNTFKRLAIVAVSVAMLMPAERGVAQAEPQWCSGPLADMREVGLHIDRCDLNHLSDRDHKWIVGVCGRPGSVGVEGPYCNIKVEAEYAFVNDVELYTVSKVLDVKKGVWEPTSVLGKWCGAYGEGWKKGDPPLEWVRCTRSVLRTLLEAEGYAYTLVITDKQITLNGRKCERVGSPRWDNNPPGYILTMQCKGGQQTWRVGIKGTSKSEQSIITDGAEP